MKNNIDFYQHYADADQHPKFKMLRVQYGWAGEGRFWALNNRIAQAENCCLNVVKKYNAASIASDLGLTLDEFKEFIKYLKEDCELIKECSPGVITTDIIQENFISVSGNREKARERKQRYLEKVSKGSPELSKSSPDQNKKGKKRKVNNIYSVKLSQFVGTYIDFIQEKFPTKAPKGRSVLENSMETIDKLIRLDGFEDKYIFEALRWAQRDSFWKKNVYSLAGLRDKSPNGLTKFQNLSNSFDEATPESKPEVKTLAFAVSEEDL